MHFNRKPNYVSNGRSIKMLSYTILKSLRAFLFVTCLVISSFDFEVRTSVQIVPVPGYTLHLLLSFCIITDL